MRIMWILAILVTLLSAGAAFGFDALAFADKAFSGAGTPEETEHSFKVLNETFPNTTKVNRMQDGVNPIKLAGRTYKHGLGVHADNHLLFEFSKPVTRFTSHVGIDSLMNGSPAEITWQVLADGKEVAAGAAAGDNTYKTVDVTLPGITRLELILDHGKEHTCDQTDWGNARVYFADGTDAWLDEIAGASRIVCRYPFSFVYGGVSSDELLPRWQFDKKSETLSDTHTVNTYTYTGDRLTVKAVVNIYTDTQALDWTIYFTGTGSVRSKMLKDVNALNVDWRLSASAPVAGEALPTGLIMEPVKDEKKELTDVVLCRTGGTIGCVRFSFDEFRQIAERLPKGETVSTVHGGTASSGGDYSPWWSLKWADGGVVCGMGWTGSWRADYTCDGENLNVKAGFGDAFNAYLKPGETVRSARIMSVFFTGDDIQTGMNLFRRSMINHVSPKQNGQAAEIPIAYTVSANETNAGTEEIDRAYIEGFRGLGFEITWFDAYVLRNGFPACMGNYHKPIQDMIDPARYPHGMEPLVKLANDAGTDLMMWFAPETVGKDTFLSAEHPEWVMSVSGKDNTGNFALVDPEAQDFMVDVLSEAFKTWDVKVWKTDSGTDEKAVATYMGETSPQRKGIAENRWAQSLYDFWDRIRESKPDLLIDNCAGGCTRLDLETMSRSIIMWRTDSHVWAIFNDNRTAILNQLAVCRLNGFVPWHTCGQGGYSPYHIRSGFNMGLSYVNPLSIMKQEDKDLLKRGVEECKRLRKYVRGDYYTLYCTDERSDQWCAWQFDRPDQKDGYFVVFRREESPFTALNVKPKGIDPDADYSVSVYETYDLKETLTMKGSELQEFNAVIPQAPGSLLVEYQKL